MANAIDLAQKFVPVLDDIYKAQSITEGLDTGTDQSFDGVNTVKVLKISTTGLGDYSRSTGYPKGDVTATWETMTLSEERVKEISIDRMDNDETLGMAFGKVTGTFLRDWVVPELDAYRFAKYASTPGINTATPAVLTKENIITAIDEAVRQLDAQEVPASGRKLYINSDLKPILNTALTRQWASDGTVNTVLAGYNDMPIIWVPKSRFYTQITLGAGTSTWGFTKAEGAANINFMIIYPEAVLQVKKFALPKIFTPDENQDMDAWKFQFRLYHDAFVYDNKVKGLYLHKAPTE